MKVPLLIALLFTAVLCRPARKVSLSSSESSEEVARRPTATLRRQYLSQSTSVQHVSVSSNSDDSSEATEEQVAADVSVQLKSASVSDSLSNSASATASASTQSPDSEDSDDDDDDDEEEDDDTEETEESESSESGEASTVSTATVSPVIVTDDATTTTIVEEMTPDPIDPTIVTDDTADSGRGDSLGSYPSEYKTIVYVEDKSYRKLPEPHKSWDYTSKKSVYEPAYGNEVHKAFKVYKGVQVHQELLEEDTSTPEVDSQDLSPRQASLDMEGSPSQSNILSQSSSDSTSDSSGTTEEEDDQAKADSISSDSTHEESTSTNEESASASLESPDGESLSQSSEESTATPGAADSQSDESEESQSEEDTQQPELTTDLPVVIPAK